MRRLDAEERAGLRRLVDEGRRKQERERLERDRALFTEPDDEPDPPSGDLPGLRHRRTIEGDKSGPAPLTRPGPGTGGVAPMHDQPTQLRSRKLVKTRYPGIYQRGSRYCVIVRGPEGRQRKRAAKTLAEAKTLRATLTADIARGEFRETSKATFAEYATDWIETFTGRTSRGLRDATRDDYRRRLKADAIPFFGRTPLVAIGPPDVKRFIAHVASRGVAANTVRLSLAPVRALLATAVEDGLIRSNPAAGVRIAGAVQEQASEDQVKALTAAELEALLAALPKEWRLFHAFLAHTGLRIGEAIALRWGDVDLVRRRVSVRRRYYRGTFAPPKSRFGRREVPLSPALALELGGRSHGCAPDELVFASERGTVIDASNLMARVLKPAAVEAGLGEWVVADGRRRAQTFGFHTLRHTCATLLFRHGVNPKQVQLWLGHHSMAFTSDTYVHLLPDDLPEVDLLDELHGATGGQQDTPREAETPIRLAGANTA